jgi:cation:H+ antiporter
MEDLSTMLLAIVSIIGGSILLYYGAEGLVRGSSSLAYRFGITPLIVGLTVVAFGTSSPEFVVSVNAAMKGNSGISLGNVIGSNICNIALILGVSALIRPIKINMRVIRTDLLIMIGITVVFVLMMLDGEISRLDGALLIVGIFVYNGVTIYMAKRAKDKKAADEYSENVQKKFGRKRIDLLFIIGGLGILILGSEVFVNGAKDIARHFGASDLLIGLTVIALGTSLPELATSVVAAIKNEGDISIGNAIGSNIFNILLILGFASFIVPIATGEVNWIDVSVMLGVSVLVLPLAWTGFVLSRLEGAFLLLIYVVYILFKVFGEFNLGIGL